MKKILIGFIIGYSCSIGLRTGHSILFNHYFNQCKIIENDPITCANNKMGRLNWLSIISGFPMYMFDTWDWYG